VARCAGTYYGRWLNTHYYPRTKGTPNTYEVVATVEADSDLSREGKAKRIEKIREEHATARAAEAVKMYEGVDRVLREREAALRRALAAPEPEPERAEIVELRRLRETIERSDLVAAFRRLKPEAVQRLIAQLVERRDPLLPAALEAARLRFLDEPEQLKSIVTWARGRIGARAELGSDRKRLAVVAELAQIKRLRWAIDLDRGVARKNAADVRIRASDRRREWSLPK
jgi:hypothetical protein